jgi:chemotaxis protein methyltransferase CheR
MQSANITCIELNENEFLKFRELIYSEAGIKLSDLKRALVQARLSRRMRFLGLTSYEDYYEYLIDNYDDEKYQFINAITTNKTDFFRECRHFEFMKETCLPEFDRMGKKKIRIWSAGCSTGEEAYSVSIVLKEYYANRTDIDIKVLSTDIDTNVLEKGRDGIYAYDRVSDIDINLLRKYFYRGTCDNEGVFKVKECIRDLVFFRRLNLLENVYPMKNKFDIIFCRNVIIYFDKATQAKLFNKLSDYLDDHGYLFIGHSENITGITNKFSLIGHTIYRKMPAGGHLAGSEAV